MTDSTLQTLLDDYISAWNRSDVDTLINCCATDVVYEDVALGKVLDLAGLKTFATGAMGNYAELRFEKVSASDDGKTVAWEWLMIRTPHDGEQTVVPGMSMTEFENGKIVRNSDYWSRE